MASRHTRRPFQAANMRKPQFAASRLPSYQSQTKTRTVIVRLPIQAKVNSVSIVPACIILQGGGARRHRSDKSHPHKKRAISGLIWEARSYLNRIHSQRVAQLPASYKRTKLPGMRTAPQGLRVQRATHPALVEPSNDTKNPPRGQHIPRPNCGNFPANLRVEGNSPGNRRRTLQNCPAGSAKYGLSHIQLGCIGRASPASLKFFKETLK